MISKALVDSILKTLPIGYYIGRNVKVSLEDCDCSYYNMMDDAIVISYNQLVGTNIDETNPEPSIRCMLYHEVSHAFLTPDNMRPTNVVNIFEDERIESLLRDYYKDVDFRQFVKDVNHYNNEEPKSADDMFYQIVRYRRGPASFLDRVHKIIVDFRSLSRINKYESYEYVTSIYRLYNDVVNFWQEKQAKQNAQRQGQEQDGEQEQTNQPGEPENNKLKEAEPQLNEDEDIENDVDLSNDSLNTEIEKIFKKHESMKDITSRIFAPVCDRYYSKDVQDEVNQILTSVKSTTKNNSTAINAYSGIFNPRSVVRDDYKYFVQQNRAGHVKAYSKTHLNLFIDCSGSFRRNDYTVNKILYALTKFEKSNPNFSFDLIACGVGQRVLPKNERMMDSNGCNWLDKQIFSQFKAQQFPNTNNINIVLFDGDAFSDRYPTENDRARFKVFDTNNTILISDDENQRVINTYVKKAKVIITKDYVPELYKNVIQSLKILSR